jgi:hypothetical protein
LITVRCSRRGKEVEHRLLALGAILSQNPIGPMLLQIAHHIRKRIVSSTLEDGVHVIGHHNEGIQLEALAPSHAIEAVHNQALQHVAPEQMTVLDHAGGHEV